MKQILITFIFWLVILKNQLPNYSSKVNFIAFSDLTVSTISPFSNCDLIIQHKKNNCGLSRYALDFLSHWLDHYLQDI